MTDPRIRTDTHFHIAACAPAGQREGDLAVEEPLEIRVAGRPVTVTMRTPGDDMELAAGLLFAEGVIHDIGAIRHCDAEEPNVVEVTPAAGTAPDFSRVQRTLFANSSCGLCGKTGIDQIRAEARPLADGFRVTIAALAGLAKTMRRAQSGFEKTGGLHAAALFDADGRLEIVREDIGRHNAVDKAVGAMLLRGRMALDRSVLLVSGRASFEIVQKALAASIPVVCAVSAPSSLAVDFARACGMTLVGFLRGEEMNVYSGEERIV